MRKTWLWLILIIATQTVARAQDAVIPLSPDNAADIQLLAFLPGNILGFTADGHTLITYKREDVWTADNQITASYTHIYLWDTHTGQLQDHQIDVGYDFPELTPDGAHVLIPYPTDDQHPFGGRIIWDVAMQQESGRIPDVLMTHSSKYAATYNAQCGCGLILWDIQKAVQAAPIPDQGGILAIKFNTDESRMYILYTGRLRVWDTQTGSLLHETPVEKCAQSIGYEGSLKLSPDEQYVLTTCLPADPARPWLQRGLVWKASDLQPVFTVDVITQTAITFTPDSTGLLTMGSADWMKTHSTSNTGTLYIWNFLTGQMTQILDEYDSGSLILKTRFSPDGNHLLTSSPYGNQGIILWDITTGEAVNRVIFGGEHYVDPPGTFNHAGSLAVLSMPLLHLVDMQGQEYPIGGKLQYGINSLEVLHLDGVYTPNLIFSPDDSLMAASQGLQTLVFGIPTEARPAWTSPIITLHAPLDIVAAPGSESAVIGQVEGTIQAVGMAELPDAAYLYLTDGHGWARLPYASHDIDLQPGTNIDQNFPVFALSEGGN